MNSLFFDDKLEKLQAEFFILPLIIAHRDKIKRSFKEYTANLTYDLNVYKNLFENAPVDQLDRSSDYGSEGWGFDSSRAYFFCPLKGLFL